MLSVQFGCDQIVFELSKMRGVNVVVILQRLRVRIQREEYLRGQVVRVNL